MDRFNEYWDEIHLQYTSAYDGWLDKYIDLFKKDSSIVELGCGRAYCSKYLLDNGFNNIVGCDFSEEVLKIVNRSIPSLKTMTFDMSEGLPFKDDSVDVIIADLCLHYFDFKTTKKIFNEIHRALKKDGYLIARVNSMNNNYILDNCKEIEKNYYFDGNIYKRFFTREDLELFLSDFKISKLVEQNMDRYEKEKIIWEFCVKKD